MERPHLKMITTSSFFHSLFRTTILLAAAFVALPAVATDEVWEVEMLMQRLSEVSRAKLSFIETKQSVLLIMDVTLEGEIVYRAPDFIEKITLSPFFEKVIITSDSMVIEKTVKVGKDNDIQQFQEYSVESHPLLQAAVESIRATLAGNIELLTENYTLQMDGGRDSWKMNLIPKSSEILNYIEQIKLTGADAEIRKIVTIQADGDESTMEVTYQILELFNESL